MKSTLVAVALALGIVSGFSSQALAQAAKAKTAAGTVTAMAADSVTVKTADADMTFSVDAKTVVTAAGAGTKQSAAQRAGAPGAKLGDVIKVGQAVSVTYTDMGSMHHASSIKATRNVEAAAPAGPAAKTSNGTVQSISATAMTISGTSGSGIKFTQSFTIDADTKVVGKGASTATKGARVVITDLVGTGDHVSVSYKEMGTSLHASDVRVTTKAVK